MSFIVFDIETVTDSNVWQPPAPEPPKLRDEKKPGKADKEFLALARSKDLLKLHPADIEKALDIAERDDNEEAVAALKAAKAAVAPDEEVMPPIYAQRPIVIGCVQFNPQFEPIWLGTATGFTPESETTLLNGWAQFVSSASADIVTWAGRVFDVPVLMLRSFHRGVAHPWYSKDYSNRYGGGHTDLMDVMTEYGAIQRNGFKLDVVSKLMGLPGKHGFDGSQVGAAFAAQRFAEIDAYCLSDAVQTAFVFLRFLLMRGRCGVDVYRNRARMLLEACKSEPRLATFVPQVNEKLLFLE